MAYLVNQTNGTLLATVLDGAVDQTHAGISLIGRQVTSYGELQNDNFVRITENFSNSYPPANPLEGQIWWNSELKTMQTYDGSHWRPVSGFTSAASAPLMPYVGDHWWDSVNEQYFIYSGSSWVLVGPAYSAAIGKSGSIVETVLDTAGAGHTIVKIYNKNTVIAIVNGDAMFTPAVAIPGFDIVSTGISLATSISLNKFVGTATNADNLGNLSASQFLRSDAPGVSNSRLSIKNQFDVGGNNELNIAADGTNVAITNTAANGNINLTVNKSGVLTQALSIDGSTGLITIATDPVSTQGIATKNYVDTGLTSLRAEIDTSILESQAVIGAQISRTQANLNSAVTGIYASLAPKQDPEFSGTPKVPTATPGTNTLQVASTEFVNTAIKNIDYSTIYNAGNSISVNPTGISVTISNVSVASVTTTGINTITQPIGTNSSKVATTAYSDRGDKNFVLNNSRYQPTCYVSSNPPDNSIGANGDMWYQYI
jgi:hypothetical protein